MWELRDGISLDFERCMAFGDRCMATATATALE